MGWPGRHHRVINESTVKHGAYRASDPASAIYLTEAGSAYGLAENRFHRALWAIRAMPWVRT